MEIIIIVLLEVKGNLLLIFRKRSKRKRTEANKAHENQKKAGCHGVVAVIDQSERNQRDEADDEIGQIIAGGNSSHANRGGKEISEQGRVGA